MPQGIVPYPFGECRICRAQATGIHYGVSTCEGCKGFFKRSLLRYKHYVCYTGGTCELTPNTRNRCKACRFQKCLHTGMSFGAVKMGRKTKVQKEKALQIHCLKISPTVADAIQISPYMEKPHPEGVNGVGLSYLHSDGPPFEDGNIKTSPNGEIVIASHIPADNLKGFPERRALCSDQRYLTSEQTRYQETLENREVNEFRRDAHHNDILNISKWEDTHAKWQGCCPEEGIIEIPTESPKENPWIDSLLTAPGSAPIELSFGHSDTSMSPLSPCPPRPAQTPSPGHYSNAVIEELMSHLSNGIFANVFDATNGAILKSTCSRNGNSYTIPPIGNELQSTHIESRMSHVKDNVTIGFEGQTRALQDCTALVKPPVTCVINKKISSLTGPLLKSKLIQSTMTRLGSVETGLEWAVKMMNDEISGRLKPHQLNLLQTTDKDDAIMFWQDLFRSIRDCSDNLITFCNRVPGVSSLEGAEKKLLLQKHFFEVWLLQNSELFHEGDFYIRLPCGARYSQSWMTLFLPRDLVNEMKKLYSALQYNHTSQLLKKVLCAVCLTEEVDDGSENPLKVQVLHNHYVDVLGLVISNEYTQDNNNMKNKISSLVSMLKFIAKRMAGVVGQFNVDELPDSCLQYLQPTSPTVQTSPEVLGIN